MLSHMLRASGSKGITYVGGTAVSLTDTISLTSLTGGIDDAPKAGDCVVLFYAVGGGTDIDMTASGYTELSDLSHNCGGSCSRINLGSFLKIMTSTPDTSATVGHSTGAIIAHVFRNVDPDTPLDISVANGSASSGAPNPPGITPVTAGAFVVAVGAIANTSDATEKTLTSSNLSGFISEGTGGSSAETIGAGYAEWVSGLFDPAAFGFDGTTASQGCYSATLALRPKYPG